MLCASLCSIWVHCRALSPESPPLGAHRRRDDGPPHRRPPARSPGSLPRRRGWPADPSPTPAVTVPASASTCQSSTPPAGRNWISTHPHPQRHPALPALPRRTRVRPARPALEHPAAHHRQPWQNRRHRPGCLSPHPIRARLHLMISLRSLHCAMIITASAAPRLLFVYDSRL
jgi:hypothetical protein